MPTLGSTPSINLTTVVQVSLLNTNDNLFSIIIIKIWIILSHQDILNHKETQKNTIFELNV